MKLAEFKETPDGDEWSEWLVLYKRDGYVAFAHEYVRPGESERRTWCDQGSGVSFEHIDGVIAALRAAKDGEP